MSWMWMGSSMMSIGEMKKLVDFLKSNDFKKDDLAAFNIHSETTKFDNYLDTLLVIIRRIHRMAGANLR